MFPFWHLLFRARTERRMSERFVRVADVVSAGMGTPLNIAVWAVLVIVWTLAFVVYPELQNSAFLPAWFTSNAYNFPLNTVTTLAELFIGFLIAAAANRVEKRNWELHQAMARMLEHVERTTDEEGAAVKEEAGELAEILAMLREMGGKRPTPEESGCADDCVHPSHGHR